MGVGAYGLGGHATMGVGAYGLGGHATIGVGAYGLGGHATTGSNRSRRFLPRPPVAMSRAIGPAAQTRLAVLDAGDVHSPLSRA